MLVRVLAVPQGCQPGELIHLEGGAAPAAGSFPKECKSKASGQSCCGAPRAASTAVS